MLNVLNHTLYMCSNVYSNYYLHLQETFQNHLHLARLYRYYPHNVNLFILSVFFSYSSSLLWRSYYTLLANIHFHVPTQNSQATSSINFTGHENSTRPIDLTIAFLCRMSETIGICFAFFLVFLPYPMICRT